MYFYVVVIVMLPLHFLLLFKSFFLGNLSNVCLFCLPLQRTRPRFCCSFLLFSWSLFHVFLLWALLFPSFSWLCAFDLCLGPWGIKYFNQNPCNFLIYAFIAVNISFKMPTWSTKDFHILFKYWEEGIIMCQSSRGVIVAVIRTVQSLGH